jgi:hypothetical protein
VLLYAGELIQLQLLRADRPLLLDNPAHRAIVQ